MPDFAVVTLDMTRDSIQSHRARQERQSVVAAAVPFLDWWRQRGYPVIHSSGLRRTTDAWFWAAGWQPHNLAGDPGAEPYDPLRAPEDLAVIKRRYSSFFETELDVTLRELQVKTVVLMGWSTSLAVITTAVDAWQRFYGVIVPSDLVAAHAWGGYSTGQQQDWALAFVRTFAVATVTTSQAIMTTDLLERFQPGVFQGKQE